MRPFDQIQNLYFVGIGGIGMSALARYSNQLGKKVFGYDKTSTALTKELEQEGMKVSYMDRLDEIKNAPLSIENTLVIYTPAIPKDNVILNYFQTAGFEVVKRAKLLGEVTKDTVCIAVAGTHGKTTTSAILGHLLAASDMPVTAFLGGIAENYNSNFIFKGTEITVVEADEFDRSFLQLKPQIGCITSMDADHLDIYGDANSITASFKEFAEMISDKKKLLVKKGLAVSGETVAVEDSADYSAQNVRIQDGAYMFDLVTPHETIKDLKFLLPGHHNLQNAVTALGMAIIAGTPLPGLPKALLSFKGVQRRFSYKIKRPDLVLIDDYAHHPTELNALFQAVTQMYPEDRKLIVFQPHLFSRTRDFVEGFAASLAQFDEILLMDIYPARELPIEGVNSQWLLDQIANPNKELISRSGLPEKVASSSARIKLLVGAGDIGTEVERITQLLTYDV